MKNSTEMLYDTIVVGTLSQGAYYLQFYWNWTMNLGDSTCMLPYNPVDSAFLSFTVTDATSISSPHSGNISISPNPATTHLTITLPELTQPAALTITNISGSIVQTEQLNAANTTIPINHLPAGLYFVTVQNQQQCIVKKLVKQ
ncbi:MAG: T9SS type A sorting domain-containing protein [Chitinophagales bacterium]|nr:T9SS type A sorting domain-containing protein [Chitinophagales bacterium]